MNLKPHTRKAAGVIVAVTALEVLAGTVAGLAFGSQMVDEIDLPSSSRLGTEWFQANQIDALLEENNCWMGDPPADQVGVIPTYAIVTDDNDAIVLIESHDALESLFGDAPVSTVTAVHAFCP